MPYKLTIEPAFLRFVFSGIMTTQDLHVLLHNVEAIEVASPVTPHRLTDLTGVDTTRLDFSGIHSFVDRRRTRKFANPIRSAIVASRPVTIGFARMFQTLNDHPQIEVRIFSNVADAEAWLMSQ